MAEIRRDLTRNFLAILTIFGLIALCIWVLKPFLAATVWATMLVVATWPVYDGLRQRFGGRQAPAVTVMTLALVILLSIPLWLAVDTVLRHGEDLAQLGKQVATARIPPLPEWIVRLPAVGSRIAQWWLQVRIEGIGGLVAKIQPYSIQAGSWLLARMGGLGGTLLQFLLIITLSAILYVQGETAATLVRRIGQRLAGDRGEQSVVLAGQAIRAVALGVGGTAIVQTLLGSLALGLAGVPFASLLSVLMLVLCIAQIGALPVLLPAAGWFFWEEATGWGIFLLVASALVASLDNVLRPLLIKRGADLPLLLIFAGVIGGLLGFGLIGIFIGPVVLAVTYTLLQAWIADALGPEPGETDGDPGVQ